MPQQIPIVDDVYELTCDFDGTKLKVAYPLGARLRPGDRFPKDPDNYQKGRCTRCQRDQMTVSAAPPLPTPWVFEPVGVHKKIG